MATERKYFRERPERSYTYATTLAIDWGHEAVRAKLYYDMGNGESIEELIPRLSNIEEMHLGRYGSDAKRQFTSKIYPFDNTSPSPTGEMVYPGNNRVTDRRSISSKIAMYAVVGISDEVARQSPELRELRVQVQQNPELKQIIRIGIEQIMYRVLIIIYDDLAYGPEYRRRNLDAIALTVPAQWTIEFEEEYGERLMAAWERIFDYAAPQLIFLCEAQTNVHYAFYRDTFQAWNHRQYLSQQGLFDIGKGQNGVLLIDAGGHSVNTSLVTICQDGNQLEIRPDRGAIGGKDLWAWQILQLAKATWNELVFPPRPFEPPLALPSELENDILRIFYYQSELYTDRSGAKFDIYHCGPAGYNFHHVVDPQGLVTAFEDAHVHTFALIEEGIVELKSFQGGFENIKIVISGGSSKCYMWAKRMSDLCRKHEVEQPIHLERIDPVYGYGRLAAGANYALLKAKSVAQFVQRAAFGLAVKKRFRGADGWTHDWHYQASMLWARGRHWTKTVTTDGTEEFKIICQPEYDNDNPQAKSCIEPNYMAYDLLPIPCRKKGTLQFDLEIDTDTDTLRLAVKHRGLSESGRTGRSTEVGRVEFDLWVPPGSRCLQIWDCVEDIEGKVTAAFSEQQQPAAKDESEGGEAQEMKVDSDSEEKPLQQRRPPRRSLRHRVSQAQQPAADVDEGVKAIKEEDKDNGGNTFSTAPLLQAQAGVPQQSAENVEMGGMEDTEEIADSITVAPMPEEPPQPRHGGAQVALRRSRRGSRVPTGMFAL